jgi:virulence factor
MRNLLINRVNQLRKEKYFQAPGFKAKKKYAFVGVGMHSLTNLYPIIHHFGLDLKSICTKQSSWEGEMGSLFPHCRFTHRLEDILQDAEIEGVFVCASPSAHYGLVSQLLDAGKKVFVDKPPCSNLTELETLIRLHPRAVCKVGLQRRYWPANGIIKQRVAQARTYIYQFYFGSYLAGDVYTELFIHALDFCQCIFGDFKPAHFAQKKDSEGITIQLHADHQNQVSGMIELSTHFSWNSPRDLMSVNCSRELLTIEYPMLVKGLQKPNRLFNLPTERLLHQSSVSKEYFSAAGLVLPVLELNTLVLQGFYGELEYFIRLVEDAGGPADQPNDLIRLRNIYALIETWKKS